MKFSNLLAAGVVTVMLGASGSAFACHVKGHDGHEGGHEGHWMQRADAEHHWGLNNLSPEHRQMVMDSMRATHEKNMALGEQMHDLHEKLAAELRAPKFNKAAFIATNNKLASLQAQMMRNHVNAFANVAAKLTPEERASFADMGQMHVGMGHGGMGHGGWMHHHGEHGEHGPMMHGDMHPASNGQRHDFKLND